MRSKKNTPWDDYLFNHRNKEFGAYQLRKQAPSNLLKSLLIVVFLLGSVTSILSFTGTKKVSLPTPEPEHPVIVNPTDLTEKKKVEKEKEEGPKKPAVLTNKKLDKNIIPDPVRNPDIETIVNKNPDLGLTRTDDPNAGSDHGGASTGDGGTGIENTGEGGSPETTVDEDKVYTVREISQMAVFPGCEKAGPGKKEIQACMARELEKELNVQLSDFRRKADEYGLDAAKTRLYFIVDKSGKITHIRAVDGGDEMLGAEAQKALRRIADRMEKKRKYIQPAQLDDGTVVSLNFSLPLYFGNR